MMCLDKQKIDIVESEFLIKYPNVLNILLVDRTTKNNIFWATDNYRHLGDKYQFYSQINIKNITGDKDRIITPRISKNKKFQNIRIKKMGEVYTPSWVCNDQNNQVDNYWFRKKNVFNKTIKKDLSWKTNHKKIIFPKGKTWKDYVKDRRLEITCGEAPYITSRYDTVTGDFIPLEERIGILDRKLRIINENVNNQNDWFQAVITAYKSTYAYEWQGDSLLLARESMLYSFIENYIYKFGKKPSISSIKNIAKIISWNVWQMDGLTGTIPNLNCNINNKVYCKIKDWSVSSSKDQIIRFIDIASK